MTLGRQKPNPIELRHAEAIGLTRYNRDAEELEGVGQNVDVMAIVAQAVNAHHRKERRRKHDSNYHEENEYPKDAPPRLALPIGMDPRRPVRQLARAGTRDFGFDSVVSLDSTVPLTSNHGVDLTRQWVEKTNGGMGPEPRLVIFVERSEDDDNPRLQQLRGSIGVLTVPRLTLITTEDPQEPPLYADLSLDQVDITPEPNMGEFGWLESV